MVTLGVTAAAVMPPPPSGCGGRLDKIAVEVDVDAGNSRDRVEV